jgi:hypothetical protein
VHVERIALPRIEIHETRFIRLTEVLLHRGTGVGGGTAREVPKAVDSLRPLENGSPPTRCRIRNIDPIAA